jgi:CO dehydrogenase maturation factor
MSMKTTPVIAVCGKGGVGKTVLAALLARVLIEGGIRPLLLIDADPAGGLVAAIGERSVWTLAGVRERLIASARTADDAEKMRLAEQVDYLVLEALLERKDYSLLAMGHSSEKGCYCPVNTLLREAIDLIASQFAAVIIDAEAGIEQINRQVTRSITRVIAVSDGSQRSAETARLIAEMVDKDLVCAVGNRVAPGDRGEVPEGVAVLGVIPEDPCLRQFDQEGRPLWELPPDTPALCAVHAIATQLGIPKAGA